MGYGRLLWNLFRLRRNAGKNRKQVEKLQQKKLRDMIRYAFENSEYYHRIYSKAGVTRDNIESFPVEKLPPVDKKILIENYEEIVCRERLNQEELAEFAAACEDMKRTYHGDYHLVHSSGSTGKPRFYVYDDDAWDQMLVGIIRGALWDMSFFQVMKLLLCRPRMLYIAATDGRYGGVMAVGDGIDGLKARQLHLDINDSLQEWCSAIQKFKPNIVIGYPSALKILAGLVEQGKMDAKFSRIITCGEPLSQGLRTYLETVFGINIVNFYGASESLALGVETDPAEGMVLFDDLNYIEVIDGQMYVTCLYNKVQPLIRYRLSDRLSLKEDVSAAAGNCHFTRAFSILGRDEDMMWFEDQNGNHEFLHPLAIEGICIEGIIDYQFRQTAKDAFELSVETEENADLEKVGRELPELIDSILEKKLKFVRYRIRYVEQIKPNPKTGKKPLILAGIIANLLSA